MREKKSAECYALMSDAYLSMEAYKNVIAAADKSIALAGGDTRLLLTSGADALANLDLLACLGRAVAAVHADIARLRAGTSGTPAGAPQPVAETVGEVYDFLMERLRAYYLERPASGARESSRRRRCCRS